MCGIAGFAGTSQLNVSLSEVVLERMLETVSHRGPDDRDCFFDSHVALGHDRLSIIDLSTRGRQPMGNEDGRIQIVFNGEIYNFKDLRTQLIAAGHRFNSRTDTEVLIHGYEEWELSGLLERIEGMFAFALWDATQSKLYLVRDHFGIKPLYYAQRRNQLVFGSELKTLLVYDERLFPIDENGLLLSIQHIGIPAPLTIYQGCRQLEPGTWLSFDIHSGGIHSERYWTWQIKPQINDPLQAGQLLWETICRSVEKHLIADVPVGVFLSGGLDSSLVAAACAEVGHKPVCLTIAIDDPKHDESPYAAALCQHYGLPHWIEKMDADAAQRFDPCLAEIFDEPFASSAALSTAYVAQLAAQHFKVMLSGEGGDELFGGYRWYRNWIDWYGMGGQDVPLWRRPGNALRALLGRRHMPVDPLDGYAQLMGAYTPDQMMGLFNFELLQRCSESADAGATYRQIDDPRLSGFNRLQSLDMKLFLPAVCLRKMDRTSMVNSLEVRVPLLDKTMASLVGRIDVNVRNPGVALKGLLKSLAQDKLPEKVLGKRKQGFSTPVRRWFPSSSILKEIAQDAAEGSWWCDVFAPAAMQTVSKLKGRPLWRFWHTWRWIKKHRLIHTEREKPFSSVKVTDQLRRRCAWPDASSCNCSLQRGRFWLA
jgi:asparagine synthase (glutamine-hydrolysing)